jgi:hypothetical protein
MLSSSFQAHSQILYCGSLHNLLFQARITPQKTFYKIGQNQYFVQNSTDARAPCCKSFYVRNLRLFVKSKSVTSKPFLFKTNSYDQG